MAMRRLCSGMYCSMAELVRHFRRVAAPNHVPSTPVWVEANAAIGSLRSGSPAPTATIMAPLAMLSTPTRSSRFWVASRSRKETHGSRSEAPRRQRQRPAAREHRAWHDSLQEGDVPQRRRQPPNHQTTDPPPVRSAIVTRERGLRSVIRCCGPGATGMGIVMSARMSLRPRVSGGGFSVPATNLCCLAAHRSPVHPPPVTMPAFSLALALTRLTSASVARPLWRARCAGCRTSTGPAEARCGASSCILTGMPRRRPHAAARGVAGA
mmetsp:Transcript_35706/g.114901  ORF Transcript_35706/g.114901 Transcript_35706/m.114901 type:complete len:267 (+) Transcript_35706:542-1342(+)